MARAATESLVPAGVTFPPGHEPRLIENFSGQHVERLDPKNPRKTILDHTRVAYACPCGNHLEIDKGKTPSERQWAKLAKRCQAVYDAPQDINE